MTTTPADTQPPAPPAPKADPVGLVLGRDLIFTAKITSTAKSLGYRLLVAGDPGLASAHLRRWPLRAVFVDLMAGDLAALKTLAALRSQAPDAVFIAFGPHVETEALAAAAQAGCDPVLTRGRFVNELPDLIRRYLGKDEAPTS